MTTYFPGQWNQAGGTWVDPSRVQTSQSGGAYIGGMAPVLPTQDMSFMWGGNGGADPYSSDKFANGPYTPDPNLVAQFTTDNPYSPQVLDLYKSVGKDPSMIDAEGGNFWTAGLADGSRTEKDFYDSAQQVYKNTLSGQASPYQDHNRAALTNMVNSVRPVTAGTTTPGTVSTPYPGGVPPGGSDPYLSGRADDISRRTQEMLGEAFAGIKGNAVGSGGLGGTRQGVAQGIAAGKAADYMAGQLANMYSGDWNASQNRGLQRYGMDQNYNLGLGGLSNQRYGMDQNFFLGNRSADQADFRNGLAATGLANEGEWNALVNAMRIYGPMFDSGTTTTNASSGGGAAGAAGGALGVYQLGKNMGWW